MGQDVKTNDILFGIHFFMITHPLFSCLLSLREIKSKIIEQFSSISLTTHITLVFLLTLVPTRRVVWVGAAHNVYIKWLLKGEVHWLTALT